MAKLDTATRCPQRYDAETGQAGAAADALECRAYHDHRGQVVLVTDPDAHFAAEEAWTEELLRIAALPAQRRGAVIREQRIQPADHCRIDEYAVRLRHSARAAAFCLLLRSESD